MSLFSQTVIFKHVTLVVTLLAELNALVSHAASTKSRVRNASKCVELVRTDTFVVVTWANYLSVTFLADYYTMFKHAARDVTRLAEVNAL